MGWFSDMFAGGVEGILGGVKGIISEFHLAPEKEAEINVKLQALIQQRLADLESTARTELQAKERVLTAELQQGDNYTKRARPTVVYLGLLFIMWNYCVVPLWHQTALPLPTEFWVAWGGIVGTWAIGRSAEKIKVGGTVGKIGRAITGGSSTLLE